MNVHDLPEDPRQWKRPPAYERDTIVSGTRGCLQQHPTTVRVVGTLYGEWPDLGEIHYDPGPDGKIPTTVVNAYVDQDGTLTRVP